MDDFNLGDGIRKVMLAGIGALATGVEKSQEIVDQLVEKGELTVNQGKELNTELKRKAAAKRQENQEKEFFDSPTDTPTPGSVYKIKTQN